MMGFWVETPLLTLLIMIAFLRMISKNYFWMKLILCRKNRWKDKWSGRKLWQGIPYGQMHSRGMQEALCSILSWRQPLPVQDHLLLPRKRENNKINTKQLRIQNKRNNENLMYEGCWGFLYCIHVWIKILLLLLYYFNFSTILKIWMIICKVWLKGQSLTLIDIHPVNI